MEIIITGTVITRDRMGIYIQIPNETNFIVVNQMGLEARTGDIATFEENCGAMKLTRVTRGEEQIWPRTNLTVTAPS